MKIDFDFIVVGSGCAGSMAAQTLVESGAKVLMLDAGFANSQHQAATPAADFLTIRHSDPDQYKYLIGSNAEGASWEDVGKGAQVTPPRNHLTEGVEHYLPIDSKEFSPLESLGYGGLGIGWGLQCWEYSSADLEASGLDKDKMVAAYETISQRIGISGTADQAARYTLGKLKTFQPSPRMDRNHQLIYQKYSAKAKRFNRRGLYLGRTPLALLTRDRPGRQKYAYRDMDFYDDRGNSAWRPWLTVNELRKKANFKYQGGKLVTSFKETKDGVTVSCLDLKTGKSETYMARRLVLAASALGSARVVLRSIGKSGQRLPLLCNPYTYIPCLQPTMVGRGPESKKLGFAQLSLFLDETQSNFDLSVASLYSYQSLMLFRIIRQLSLDFVDARTIMSWLMSGLIIMGVHHPDSPSPHKYLELVRDKNSPTGDKLQAHYRLSPSEQAEFKQREQKMTRAMRRLGVYKLKRVDPGYGASIHYAGTLPFSAQDRPLTLAQTGRLHGTRRVYVADSSGFNYLPARGLTFSLMANAHIIAGNALND